MDPDSPTAELPPPAYDAQEFDRKVSIALDRSTDPALQTVAEEEWEEWDDERFQAAATGSHPGEQHPKSTYQTSISRQNSKKSYTAQSSDRLARQSSSSSSFSSSSYHNSVYSNRPPATESRSRRLPSSPHKERPSWYTEAHLHLPARSDTIRLDRSHTPPVIHHDISLIDDDLDNNDEPLPPFASVGPSLEGPPFSEYPAYPPPQPFSFPYSDSSSHQSYQISPPRSPPPQRRTVNPPPFRHRPASSSPPVSTSSRVYSPNSHSAPTSPDPGLLYSRQRQITTVLSRDEESGPVDPTLLYNSAVASVMKKSKSMQPLKKQNRERSIDPNERQSFDSQSTRSSTNSYQSSSHVSRSFDSQSIRSSTDSYQGSSHVPRITHYVIPTLPSQPTRQSLPPTLPTLPTIAIDDYNPHQADPRHISPFYTHPNASQWSQAPSSYGYGRMA